MGLSALVMRRRRWAIHVRLRSGLSGRGRSHSGPAARSQIM